MTELEKFIQRREQILTEIDAVLQDEDGSPRVELTDDQQLEHDTLVEEFDSVSAKITELHQRQQDQQTRTQQHQSRRQFTLPEGIPELGKPGSTVKDETTFRWILDKKFIQLDIKNHIDGKLSSQGREIIGWDAKSGKVVHWIFGSTGFHGPGVWRKDGDAWLLDWSGSTPDKTNYTGTSIHRQIDKNTYMWQMINLTKNGKKIPDWPDVQYKRKTNKKKRSAK